MRLIDADSAKLSVSDYKIFRCQLGGLMDVAEFIDDQPTINAVPVVRCRECKHYATEDFDGDILCGCTLHSAMVDIMPDSFCSYGERKGCAD